MLPNNTVKFVMYMAKQCYSSLFVSIPSKGINKIIFEISYITVNPKNIYFYSIENHFQKQEAH